MSIQITSVGGGPAGLYFAILMMKAFPDTKIRVYERNKPDDTFGWGVVFSDETLGNFQKADAESFAEIEKNFIYWSEMETFYGGTKTVSTGHGFCGLARKTLLNILQRRATALGVEITYEKEIDDLAKLPKSDLILAADGIHSKIRERFADHFKPSFDWRKCKFAWFGTTKELKAFTFVFKETPYGLFQVHAYPFEAKKSTWIVECREETWKKAGLDKASEAETLAFCENLFKDDLDGHPLLVNKTIWRTFPTIKNEKWSYENIVLMGDAVHTAHFSIGSGTKLAMEDAIALVDAFKAHGTKDIPKVLAAYEAAHKVDTIKIQKSAQPSMEWFENSARYMKLHPTQFKFSLMTRSKRITYDNLRKRDPKLVAAMTDLFAKENGRAPGTAPIFAPFTLRGMTLENRIVVSPMCQYSATDGLPNDWHMVHLGSRAIGGAGLVIAEATGVAPDGRITPGCTGMWKDVHIDAWKKIVEFVHTHSKAKIALQLAHAGRKGSANHPWDRAEDTPLTEGGWPLIAPSAIALKAGWPVPRAMKRADMDRVRDQFVLSTLGALVAGFDMIELHLAHGYLLSSFLSPLTNMRTDEYGGSLENRARFPLEIFDQVRRTWPTDRPISVRISATDWVANGGFTPDDAVLLSRMLKEHGADIIDVSSGGVMPDAQIDYGRMYQVPFAEQIRFEAGIPVMAVGAIQNADHANTVIAAGRADLCAIARAHLADPYLTLHAAEAYGYNDQYWPGQYLAAKPRG